MIVSVLKIAGQQIRGPIGIKTENSKVGQEGKNELVQFEEFLSEC